ncbi:MAG: DEAD/DEAH box helicase [Candidatus Thorarchaeota archaeon]|nr:MAG: DEAD/DEAH box helicase [Candidatus Thorarchaeota archaeon]
MEIADADIQKRLAKPYTIVLRPGRQEMTTRVDIFSDVLRDRQRTLLGGMIEFGRRPTGLLEIKRFWFVKYNKRVYMFVPKEAHEILRKAKHIIIPREQKPEFLKDLLDLLSRLKTQKPRIVPTCQHCLREDRLSVLTRRNAVKISENQVTCTTCAQSDLKTELKTLGIHLSRAMINQLEKQVSRIKSVPRLVDMMTPGFDPTREPDLTLIDTVVAEDISKSNKIRDLPIPDNFKEILTSAGLEYLLPIQSKVVKAGLFKDVSMLIVSSTSSGKTLLGELAGVPKAMKGKKMIYMSPLVALTNEKYEQFRKSYKPLGLRVGIKVGMSRLDVGKEGRPIVDTDIKKADIICATYEALDLIFRSGRTDDLGEVGTVIIDEIQNLADPERGPELDGLLSRMRFHYPKAQYLALSATVGSPEVLAKEMKLKLVNYEGRPVPLERHLVFARSDDEKRSIIRRLVNEEFRHVSSSGNKGQSIIFTYARRRAHSLSDWLREHRVSAAIYHGGLSYSKRRQTERSFSKQRQSCVVTTAALGAGVDLAASQVIFESLAMGAEWLSTAEFEQMLGRAGRLGKHDRGKVYLIVQPDRKYHSGQDKVEDEVAVNLLNGIVEDVEPFADKEASSEQLLATICSTGLVDLKAVALAYKRMLSMSVPPSEALKHLVRKHMIRVKDGEAHPTDLGRATSLSFLTPSMGLEVMKLTASYDVIDIAVMLEPFRNVYLSNKLQEEVNSAFRTHMPTRFFSGVFNDISDASRPQGGAGRLPQWVFEIFGRWASTFFTCGCRDYPECDHGKITFGRWLVERRKEGFNPSGLARKLHDDFELWAYPGDIFSWLDSLIHSLKAVQRIANVAGKTDLSVEIEGQIASIERPLDKETQKEQS